jgi:putative SOS response-associated peptidase YedK
VEELDARLGARFGVKIRERTDGDPYNIAPTEQVLAIVAPKGEPQARLLRWGLVPTWADDLKGSYRLINARMETVSTKAAYRDLIPRASRRGLQIADGYYEWLKPERPREARQPFHFQVDGGEPFAFAALWTPAKIDGGWIASCTLITCSAADNPLAAAIHDRMPAILADAEAQHAWLDPGIGAEEALSLCVPLPAERMSVRPVNPAVNKVGGVEGPVLLEAPG